VDVVSNSFCRLAVAKTIGALFFIESVIDFPAINDFAFVYCGSRALDRRFFLSLLNLFVEKPD
jgi:hypothetical protein